MKRHGYNEETVLIIAAEVGNKRCGELLIQAGAELNKTGWNGKTALMYALESNKSEFAHMLLDAGASVLLKSNGWGIKTTLAYAKNKKLIKRIKIMHAEQSREPVRLIEKYHLST